MSKERAWQTKEGALKLLRKLAGSCRAAVQAALPELVPVGSECLVDARDQVRTPPSASQSGNAACPCRAHLAHTTARSLHCWGESERNPQTPLLCTCVCMCGAAGQEGGVGDHGCRGQAPGQPGH